MLFLANFFSSFRGNRIVVRHDVGFLDAAIKLVGLTTLCFAARVGFIFFAWLFCGVILGVFFEYFTLLGGVSGSMQKASFICTGHLLSWRDWFFVLQLPVRPSSGLIDEAAYPPFILLTWLSRLASALSIILERVCTLYIYSEISIHSNMAQVSLKVFISKSHLCM